MDTSKIEDFLECSICLELLDERHRVLPCQHTFCMKCLDIIVESKGHLQCPECRSSFRETQVNDLPRNVLLVRILEGLKTKRRSSAASTASQSAAGAGAENSKENNRISRTGSSEDLKKSKRLSAREKGTSQDVDVKNQVKCEALLNQPSARGLYSFMSDEDGDLSFAKGDIITLLHEIDDNWVEGMLNGKRGSIPKNFVEILLPLPKIDDPTNTIPFAKAVYTFESREDQELISFKEGDIIPVIKKVDSNWLEGVLGSQYGIFPLNFMKLNKAAQGVMNGECGSSSSSGTSSGSDEETAENKQKKKNRRSTKAKKSASPCERKQNRKQQAQTEANQVLPTNIPTSEQSKRHTIHLTNEQEHRRQSRRALNLSDELDPQQRDRTQSQGRRASESSVGQASGNPQERSLASAVLLERALRNSDDQLTCLIPSSSNVPISMTSSLPCRTDLSLTFSTAGMPTNQSSPVGAGGETYTALFTYSPAQDDELALIQGDQYIVLEKHLDGWFKGVHARSRQCGVFPGNYVKLSSQVSSQMLRSIAASPSRNVIGYGSNPSSPSAVGTTSNVFNFPPRGPETPNGSGAPSPRRGGEASSPSRGSGFGLLKILKKNKSKRPTPPTPQATTPTNNDQSPPSYYHSSMPAPAHHRLSRPSPMVPAEPPPPYTPTATTTITTATTTTDQTIPTITTSTSTMAEKFRVIVNYERLDSRELTLQVGDIIYVTRKHTDGWYTGKSCRTGESGVFPSTFVEAIQ